MRVPFFKVMLFGENEKSAPTTVSVRSDVCVLVSTVAGTEDFVEEVSAGVPGDTGRAVADSSGVMVDGGAAPFDEMRRNPPMPPSKRAMVLTRRRVLERFCS